MAAFSSVASAQDALASDGSFVGTSKPSPGCPSVVFHVLRNGDALSGVVFYADKSGVSTVNGTVDGNKFQWSQTSVSGKGPPGNVTGTVTSMGKMVMNLTGTDCKMSATVPVYSIGGG
jgi:hypothetical protein